MIIPLFLRVFFRKIVPNKKGPVDMTVERFESNRTSNIENRISKYDFTRKNTISF